MASGITTAQQLQDVLDAIHDNISQMDVYQGLSELGSLRLCWNDISRTATIFKRINEDENREEVVCTFNPENIVIGTDTFQGKMLKNIVHNATTTVTRSNDVGLGGYVGLKTLIRNICAALGVNLASNFDEINPTIYGDLVNIVKKYYGDSLQNNAPYGLARKDTTSGGTTTTTYNSYIPIMIIVDIAIYLNGLGVFSANTDKIYIDGMTLLLHFPFSTSVLSTYPAIKNYIKSINDVYSTISVQDFFKNCKNYIIKPNYNYNGVQIDGSSLYNSLVTALKSNYENSMDSSNVLLMVKYPSNDSNYLTIYEFPATCTITSKGFYVDEAASYLTLYNFKEDYYVIKYTATMDVTTRIVTTTKDVVQVAKDTYYGGSSASLPFYRTAEVNSYCTNIDYKYYYKYYDTYAFKGNTSSPYKYYKYIDNIAKLSNSTRYDNIKIIPATLFDFSGSVEKQNFVIYRNRELFSNNDLVLITSARNASDNYVYKVYVFKNVNSLAGDYLANFVSATLQNKYCLYDATATYRYGTPPPLENFTSNIPKTYTQALFGTTRVSGHYLEFFENLEYKVYETANQDIFDDPNLGLLVEVGSGTTDKYTFTIGVDGVTSYESVLSLNLGELVEIQESSALDGITLQDNATYPSSVIDYNTFNTTYPDWGKIGYSQPYFEEDQIAGTYTAQWAAISVDTDTPTSQADSQAGEIDFTDTDLVDDIIDDIDNADDGNDEEEVDPNSDEIEGEGETPDDELDRIEPNVLTGGFVKQYALTAAQMQELATCLTNPDLLQTVVRAFRDPMKAIVSLQLAYKTPTLTSPTDIILYGFDWSSLTNKPKGYPLATNIINFDFGTLHIDPLYKTYQDITTTSIELYLPCIGFIPLNPAEFLDRGLDVEGKIDTLSGTIVYDISAYDGKKRKLLYQKTGNCQLQLPISSNDNSTIFGALMGVGGMALGGFTGNPLLMAQGAATTGASMVQGPNYEHGGSISANAGLMTKMIPCVIIKRNQVYNPTHLNELHGLPANSYVKLGSCSGYTVVQDVKVDIQGATQSEKSQIETLLKGGVIL